MSLLMLHRAQCSFQVYKLSYCRSCVACFSSQKGTDRFSSQRLYHPAFPEYNNVYTRSLTTCSKIHRPLYSPFLISNSQFNNRSIGINQDGSNIRLQKLYKQSYANFHTSLSKWKEESKVEKTVKALKDTVEEAKKAETSDLSEKETRVVVPKKTIPQRLVAAIKHYYHGFRLLFIDMRICSKLIWRILNGESLTRREHKQLVRTTADMFRLLPMLVFVLVPFAEFLLPVALTLFPNMLPSTFAEEKTEKEKVKKTLKAKIEMAKFLQETLKESAVTAKKQEGQTESFSSFIDQIRDQGIKPKTKDIMRFAKLFEDEITLDNLNRQQLRACCIMLGITPMGSDALLRFLLEMKLRRLLTDDKMIQQEGIESLTIAELQAANRSRGMRALGVSEDRLRDQLKQWMQLHLEEKIPTSLLLLSRALYLSETLSTEEKISVTITQLADTATNEAKVKVAEMSGETVDNKSKMDIIKHEEEIIASEKAQLETETKIQQQVQREAAEAKAAETVMESQVPSAEELVDKAEVIEASPAEEFAEEKSISTDDMCEMGDVLEKIAEKRQIDVDQDALEDLKEEFHEYKEDLEDLKDVSVASGNSKKQFSETKAAKRLKKKIDKMVKRLDKVVTHIKKESTNLEDKMSTEEEKVEEQLGDDQWNKNQITVNKRNILSLNELMDALQTLKDAPDDTKWKHIFDALDQDKDGNIDLNQALKVLEHLDHEHLQLKASHVDEVMVLLRNEAVLEEAEQQKEREEKEKKLLEKEQKQQN